MTFLIGLAADLVGKHIFSAVTGPISIGFAVVHWLGTRGVLGLVVGLSVGHPEVRHAVIAAGKVIVKVIF